MQHRYPSSSGTEPYPGLTQPNQHHLSLSCSLLSLSHFLSLSLVSGCSLSVMYEDKDPGSLCLSSSSDKFHTSHHCWERLPSSLMLEAVFFSLILKYGLFKVGSLDLNFQNLHLTVFKLTF